LKPIENHDILLAIHCNYKELLMACGVQLERGLRERGFRVTPQRGVILETIAHGHDHQSVQEVYDQASESLPGLNIATVYRTLEMLHRAGLVDLLSTRADIVRFSLHDPEHPHYHLICSNCDEVLEMAPDLLDQLSDELKRDHGFSLDSSHMTLTGICRACEDGGAGMGHE
jgi:Fur family ferric uptake transcriptional regulator